MFRYARDTFPTARALVWPDDFDDFREAGVAGKDGVLWSPATYPPGSTRKDANVLSVCALVLDYDPKECRYDPEEITGRWSRWEHVIHSTFTAGGYRVILPYAAPLSPATHRDVYAWALGMDGRADPSCSNPGRIFYWPTVRTDVASDPVFGYVRGEPLDPARLDLLPAANTGARAGTRGSLPSASQPRPAGPEKAPRDTPVAGTDASPYAGVGQPDQQEDLALIESRCAFMAHVRADAATLAQPEWYAALGIIARCRGGDDLAHEVSAPYAGYTEDECETTYQRAKTSAGPRTCADIRRLSAACQGCTVQVKSPVMLGRSSTPLSDDGDTDADTSGDLLARIAEAEARYVQARIEEDAAAVRVEAARRRQSLVRAAKTSSEQDVADAVVGLGAARESLRVAERVRKAREREHAAAKATMSVAGLPDGANPSVWQRLRMNRDGDPRGSMANILTVLEDDAAWSQRLSFDAFAQDVCLDGVSLPEESATRLVARMGREYHLDTSTPLLLEGVRAVAIARRFHPIQDWLRTLTWDGTPRMQDLLLRGFGADPAGDEELVVRIGEQFLLSLLARAFTAGAKVDTMLVLTGKQGMFKSSSFEALVGTSWFLSTKLDLHNKDSFIQLRGKWLVEFGELAAVRRSDDNVSKGWLSNKVDNYRAPYARRAEDHPRSTVACGTTNEDEFLQDPTGYRRYRPVSVGRADLGWLSEYREQLFAEALVLRAQGGERATWWFDENTDWSERMRQFAQVYVSLPPWTEPVVAWLEATAGDANLEVFSIVQVLTRAIGRAVVDVRREDQTMIGNILKHIGCPRADRVEEAGHHVTRYRRPASMLANRAAKGQIVNIYPRRA